MASSTPRPLLSASLIVKDEEAMLPRCLAALEGVVDEVVVLDTGSTDRTVEVAEAAGAVVHRSGWYDDFGRSRNESIAHCRGRWVLVVDADEVLRVDDVQAFRKELARSTADAMTVRVENAGDHGGSVTFTHDPVRLLRPSRLRYEGRIHEHPVPIRDRAVETRHAERLTIMHYGYVAEVVASKDKVRRNADLARAAWREDPDDVLTRIELVRSLASTGCTDEMLEHLAVLREVGGDPRKTALTLGVKALTDADRLQEALEWAETIVAEGSSTVQSAGYHAALLSRLGRQADALAVLEAMPDHDADSGVHGTHEHGHAARILQGRLLAAVGREDEAADHLLSIAEGATDDVWPQLLDLLHRRGELARAVDPFLASVGRLGRARAEGVLAGLSHLPIEVGDAFAEQIATQADGLPIALAFVLANAERLTIERAAEWSAVVRAAELPDSCPLLVQMDSSWTPVVQRFTAAAMVVGLEDDRGRAALERAAAMLTDLDVADALYVVSELAPTALVDLVSGFVSSQRRALVLANALVDLGGHEEAVAVLQHGLAACVVDPESAPAIEEALVQLGAAA